jgi:hypothetical protein
VTIICITNTPIPGMRPCTVRDEHKITCPDRDVNRALASHVHGEAPDPTCGGCLPRLAHRGYLCQGCFARLESVYAGWERFARTIQGVDRAVQRDNAGVRTRPEGHIPIPLTSLSVDECWGFLASFTQRSLDEWVSTPAGAADAVQFTRAAQRAYRDHPVEEAETELRRVRCPSCKQLTLTRRPPATDGQLVTVKCQNTACGHTIREGEEALSYVPDPTEGWRPVRVEKLAVIRRIERNAS